MEATALLTLFNAHAGLVCAVGAGGKKSVLHRLAAAHPGRVALTATAHIERFAKSEASRAVIAAGGALHEGVLAKARTPGLVLFAKPCPLPGRLEGLSFDELNALRQAAGFDLTLVKADGARNRVLKAPAPHEPALPRETTTVVPVCGARALGLPLDERLCHRPERFSALTGLALHAPVAAEHLARWLASPEGALKNVGEAMVVPVINMVDDEPLLRVARQAAEQALEATTRFDRVVLAEMRNAARPVVTVVERHG